ncbi:hypothetical protein GCM10007392_14480 [Saccharospirillum salsuginis]|uniref:Uncharacterized protein n=1 Tax=Saccharospirillum salsuginis TaxID=418750 RepID=A0A918N8P8_9GAMM|nr:hypothetical protein GCM10007392_14480 [Saccharospirillum salsuginis]
MDNRLNAWRETVTETILLNWKTYAFLFYGDFKEHDLHQFNMAIQELGWVRGWELGMLSSANPTSGYKMRL